MGLLARLEFSIHSCTLYSVQGAGWCGEGRKYTIHNDDITVISTSVSAADVDALSDVAPVGWAGDVAVFAHTSGE